MHMRSSLQYLPAVPLTLLQLLVHDTPQLFLQTADFPAEHTIFFVLSCFMRGE